MHDVIPCHVCLYNMKYEYIAHQNDVWLKPEGSKLMKKQLTFDD